MSIASALTALAGDISAARAAVTAKGGTPTADGGSSQLAADIATIPAGGGETVYETSGGNLYIADTTLTTTSTAAVSQERFSGASELVSFSAPNITGNAGGNYTFRDCPKLKTVFLPKIAQFNSYMTFSGSNALESVQLGSVGYPVNKIQYNLSSSAHLTLTIYVADDMAIPLSGSPWACNNATIIYRSSTTGEVRTV